MICALGQAAGAHVADELAAVEVGEDGAGHLHQRPGIDDGDGEHRQDEARGRRAEGLEVAGDQAVDGVEAGDHGRGAEEGIDPAEGRRGDAGAT